MQHELEGGDDAEVAAAAVEAPEQVGVLALAGAHLVAAGGDDVGRDEVVARHPVPAGQPAHPAAQGQTRDAGVGDDPSGRGQREGLRLVVQLAPEDTRVAAGAAPVRVDPHAGHGAEVDDQPAVAHPVPGEAVPAGPDRDEQPG